MNFTKIVLSTVFIFSTFFTASGQNITLTTQAEVDAFDKSITIIKGNFIIGKDGGTDITNLNSLSEVTAVGGYLYIRNTNSLTNLDDLSQIRTVGGNLTIYSNSSLTNLDGLSQIKTISKNLTIQDNNSLTNLDGLSGITAVDGYLRIEKNNSLTNLDGLSQVTAVGRYLYIHDNSSLTNLDGLSQITEVGTHLSINENVIPFTISKNISLTDCCGIQPLLSKPGAIKGKGLMSIGANSTSCDSKATILSASCDKDTPDEGEEVKESDYKKNLYQLTRWEVTDCGNIANYKFTKEDTYTLNGKSGGSYKVEGKTLTITPNGGTAKTYTITKMTTNVMHLNDVSGKETIYGRKQHFSTEKLSGTNWKEKGGTRGSMGMKFLDATNVEFVTIGNRGSKMAATYTMSPDNKKMTITFKDAAKAQTQGFSPTLVLNMTTFNYMMMKLDGGDGVICFNRTR